MSTNVKIEVDEQTADVLRARAAELGVTVSELVAELATLDSDPLAVDSNEIAELDRRWNKVEAGAPTIPHERVVRWLRTWGTPGFRPWRARRRFFTTSLPSLRRSSLKRSSRERRFSPDIRSLAGRSRLVRSTGRSCSKC